MRLYLIVAFRNLLQAKRRGFLLSSALALVTFLLVMLLALTQGLVNTMIESVTTISSGHINVSGFYKITPGSAIPLIQETTKLKEIISKNTPNLDYLIDRHRGWAKMVSDSSNQYTLLSGIDIKDESRLTKIIQLAQEQEYKDGGGTAIGGDLKKLADPDSILLFAHQARRLEVGVGDQLTLVAETGAGVVNTMDVTVAAVARDLGMSSNWTVFLSKEAIRNLYRHQEDVSGAVHVYLKDIKQAAASLKHLREVLEKEGYRLMDYDPNPFFMKFDSVMGEDWQGQKLDLTIWSDEVSFLKWIFTSMNVIIYFFIGILMALIGIGIMNTMWISVRERTNEIGTLRAIGMSRRRVLGMFLLETVLLALFATSVGALAGALLATGLNAAAITVPSDAVRMILMSNTLHLTVQPGQVIGSIFVLSLISALAALWPAFRASQLQPVTAIHYVG